MSSINMMSGSLIKARAKCMMATSFTVTLVAQSLDPVEKCSSSSSSSTEPNSTCKICSSLVGASPTSAPSSNRKMLKTCPISAFLLPKLRFCHSVPGKSFGLPSTCSTLRWDGIWTMHPSPLRKLFCNMLRSVAFPLSAPPTVTVRVPCSNSIAGTFKHHGFCKELILACSNVCPGTLMCSASRLFACVLKERSDDFVSPTVA
mmetsp:Transcript_65996/g.130090  ORF Transcript_65996/g.130090 Transcript_65996/m.130090 type:complete len:203 (-) Transcript_65996:2672-3280(-)